MNIQPAINDEAIINPVKGKKSPDPGSRVIMVSSDKDLSLLRQYSPVKDPPVPLMMSRIYSQESSTPGFSLAGPVVSAAYAVMLAEALIAWGARQILFWGWCGALSPEVKIGDVVVPAGAIGDEGTSVHYGAIRLGINRPCPNLTDEAKTVLQNLKIPFHEGLIWTTDAVYRETIEKVTYFQSRKALAVEMELSALFALGHFRKVQISAVLMVSDELSEYVWKPGFKDRRFAEARMKVTEAFRHLCHNPK
jgi:hypothetical protein